MWKLTIALSKTKFLTFGDEIRLPELGTPFLKMKFLTAITSDLRTSLLKMKFLTFGAIFDHLN